MMEEGNRISLIELNEDILMPGTWTDDPEWQQERTFVVLSVLGQGTTCLAYKVQEISDNSNHQDYFVLKMIIKKEYMDMENYKKSCFSVFNCIYAYKEAEKISRRHTAKICGFFRDAEGNGYILQEFYEGKVFSAYRTHSKYDAGIPDLEEELRFIQRILWITGQYHSRHIVVGDVKQENYFVVQESSNAYKSADILYFDLDMFNERTGVGRPSYPANKLRYIDEEGDKKKNDVKLILLMLYERLCNGQLPSEESMGGLSICKPYINSEAFQKLYAMLRKGIFGDLYQSCEEAAGMIEELMESLRPFRKRGIGNREDLRPFTYSSAYTTLGNTYVPRDHALQEIYEKLHVEESGKRICILSGEGGCGKSELLRAYAYHYYEDYDEVFLVTCPDGKALGVQELLERYYPTVPLEYFKELGKESLLLVDNYNEDTEAFFHEIRKMTGNAAVLITSRVKNIERYGMANCIDLNEYQTGEFAYQIFVKNYCREQEGKIREEYVPYIEEICRCVGENPLLVSMVAASMRRYEDEEFVEFACKIKKQISSGLNKKIKYSIDENVYGTEQTERVSKRTQGTTILEILFRDLLQREFSWEERQVLTVLSTCTAESINREAFCELLGDIKYEREEIWNACEELWKNNWIQCGGNQAVMHPIISEVLSLREDSPIMREREKEELLVGILQNWILQKYDVSKSEQDKKLLSPEIIRIVKNMLFDYMNSETVYENHTNTLIDYINGNTVSVNDHWNLYILAAYELGDKFTADTIVKRIYGGRKKPITFIIGQGSKTKDCYIFSYDCNELVEAEMIHPCSPLVKWRGKFVWCWEKADKAEKTKFKFGTLIRYSTKGVIDYIEITEIAKRCFANNKNITTFEWVNSKNEESGKYIEPTWIGDYAFENSELSVFSCFSSKIDGLEKGVFKNCNMLQHVFFHLAPIRYFEGETFYNCYSLEEVVFHAIDWHMDPYIELEVGCSAFENCVHLKKIASDGKILKIRRIEENAFNWCNQLKVIFHICAENIGARAFGGCESLKHIKLLGGCRNIERGAFEDCCHLVEVEFPNTVSVIEKDAFRNTNLKKIKLQGAIRKIELGAFDVEDKIEYLEINSNGQEGNAKLERCIVSRVHNVLLRNVDLSECTFYHGFVSSSVVLEGSVTLAGIEIGSDAKMLSEAFIGCTLELLEKQDSNSKYIFGRKNKRIMYKIQEIVLWCFTLFMILGFFASCIYYKKYSILGIIMSLYVICVLMAKFLVTEHFERLRSVQVLKRNMKRIKDKEKIEKGDFQDIFYKLDYQEIQIPDIIVEVDEETFKSLSVRYIKGENVSKIRQQAFYSCHLLKQIDMPNIQIIEKSAFSFCEELEVVNWGQRIKYIGDEAFFGCKKMKNISFSEGLERIGISVFEKSGVEKVILPTTLDVIERYAFREAVQLTEVNLKCKHSVIKQGAFALCESLKKINWEHVELIEDGSFMSCGFVAISLPSISCVPDFSFANNKYLKSVDFTKEKIEVGQGAFFCDYQLSNLTSRHISSIGKVALVHTALRELWFENLSYIGEGVFMETPLMRVFIRCTEPKLHIESHIFEGCTALEQVWIYYSGEVEISRDAFSGTSCSIYVLKGTPLEEWAKKNSITSVVAISEDMMENLWEKFSEQQDF